MEYCENGTLESYIKNGINRYNKDLLILELCNAIQYIASKGYVHRDLKPTNIFISKTGNIKIGDFGSTRLLGTELASAT